MKSPIPEYLEEVLDAVRGDTSGAVADYIPELAVADPDRLAVAIASTNGATYAAGDVATRFSIQSMSKPFAYAAAILDRGLDAVMEYVGVEPSGEAFNELSLERGTHRPMNPMINAGAITTHALLGGEDADVATRVDRVLSFLSALAGRQLEVDEQVCASELDTADRNLAIAHMLASYGVIRGSAHDVVEGYTRQCSILVTVEDLAVMAATFATGGVQPITGERIVDPATARHVMAVMAAAGMYDGAGEWLTKVGIPAKSGVAGGMVGVLPNQVGVGVLSPRLDANGNSQRGKQVFERLSRDMGMHAFAADGGRTDAVSENATADGVSTYRLSGSVQFTAAAELLDRMANATTADEVILDASRVHSFTDVGRRMVLEGLRRLHLDDVRVMLIDPRGALPDPNLGDGSYPELIEP